MQKETFYQITIAILLIFNLTHLGLQLYAPPSQSSGHPSTKPSVSGPPHPPPHLSSQRPAYASGKNFQYVAVRQLQLNETQTQQFLALAKAHQERMQGIHEQQKQLITRYFEQPSESRLKRITDLDRQKITVTEAHFQDVFALLQGEQKKHFETFRQNALHKILQ